MRALVLAVALLVGLPTAAHADRWVGSEAVGDAVSHRLDPADSLCQATEVDSEDAAGHDITGLVVRHQPRKVVVRIRYAAPSASPAAAVDLHVRTPRRDLLVMVSHHRGGWSLRVGDEMEWEPAPIDGDGDGDVDCEGWAAAGSFWRCRDHHVELADHSLVVALPRGCLSDPAWVKVGAEAWGGTADVSTYDEWGTSDPFDPTTNVYGSRVRVSPGQKASPSNRSRVTNSATSWRRSFVISRTGLPSGTTAATAY